MIWRTRSAAGTLSAAIVTGSNGTATVNFNQTGSYTFNPRLTGNLSVNKLGAGTDAGKAQDRTGQPVDATLARDGTIRGDPALGAMSRIAAFRPETGHNIPDVFANYFKQQSWDWVYVAGYPISEPYWAHVSVAGQPRSVHRAWDNPESAVRIPMRESCRRPHQQANLASIDPSGHKA